MNPPALGPISTRITVQEHVYLKLRHALMTGQFDPGQALVVKYLEEQFLTSSMPIREALRRLAAEGALEIDRGGSARIPQISRERLVDLMAARVTVEGSIAARATPNLTKDDIRRLELILDSQTEAGRREGIYGMLIKNQEFHFALYAGARSDVLLRIAEGLWLRYGPYLRVLSRTQPAPKAVGSSLHVRNHGAILKALKKRDADAVQAALAADILDAQAMLEEHCPWETPALMVARPERGKSGARAAVKEAAAQRTVSPRKRAA